MPRFVDLKDKFRSFLKISKGLKGINEFYSRFLGKQCKDVEKTSARFQGSFFNFDRFFKITIEIHIKKWLRNFLLIKKNFSESIL